MKRKILIVGPAGAGKSYYATDTYGNNVVHLDNYRKRDGKSSFSGVPLDFDVYEGNIKSSDPLVRILDPVLITFVRPMPQSFREANRLKYLYAKDHGWDDNVTAYFKRNSLLTDHQYKKMMDNEISWWRKVKGRDVSLESVNRAEAFIPTQGWANMTVK